MKIKMTQEEAKGMLKYFEHPHFTNVRNYITVLEVDPNWVKEILPPPLEMADPVVRSPFLKVISSMVLSWVSKQSSRTLLATGGLPTSWTPTLVLSLGVKV